MITIDLDALLVYMVITAAAGAVAFWVKDSLRHWLEYRRLRSKLTEMVAPGQHVIYEQVKYKLVSIDRRGITLQDKARTVFVPPARVLEREFIVPADNYEAALAEMQRDEIRRLMEGLVPDMLKKMKESLIAEFSAPGSRFHAMIGMKVEAIFNEVKEAHVKELPPAGSEQTPPAK